MFKTFMPGLIAMVLLAATVMASSSVWAVNPDEVLEDPALETRARAISTELRCLVCQNQSIDDSDAPLARDLRILVRERLVAGDTDQQAKDFLVSRYGEFVLLKPTFSSKNILLWAFGPLVLLFGLASVFLLYRKNRIVKFEAEASGQNQLSEDEKDRLKKILSDESEA